MTYWRVEHERRQRVGRENASKLKDVLLHFGVKKVLITYNGGNDECHAEMALDHEYTVNDALEHQVREEMGLGPERDWHTDPFTKLGWELGEERARDVEYVHSGSGSFWVDTATWREIPDTHHGSRTYEEDF
jgi:hypothetical protein